MPGSISKVELHRCIMVYLPHTQVDVAPQYIHLTNAALLQSSLMLGRVGQISTWQHGEVNGRFSSVDLKIKRLPEKHAWLIMKPVISMNDVCTSRHGGKSWRPSHEIGQAHFAAISINFANDGDDL